MQQLLTQRPPRPSPNTVYGEKIRRVLAQISFSPLQSVKIPRFFPVLATTCFMVHPHDWQDAQNTFGCRLGVLPLIPYSPQESLLWKALNHFNSRVKLLEKKTINANRRKFLRFQEGNALRDSPAPQALRAAWGMRIPISAVRSVFTPQVKRSSCFPINRAPQTQHIMKVAAHIGERAHGKWPLFSKFDARCLCLLACMLAYWHRDGNHGEKTIPRKWNESPLGKRGCFSHFAVRKNLST